MTRTTDHYSHVNSQTYPVMLALSSLHCHFFGVLQINNIIYVFSSWPYGSVSSLICVSAYNSLSPLGDFIVRNLAVLQNSRATQASV